MQALNTLEIIKVDDDPDALHITSLIEMALAIQNKDKIESAPKAKDQEEAKEESKEESKEEAYELP